MRSQKSLKKFIGFRGKIILIVVGILSLSYSLGMFLSVLSFEKIYLKTLTSKYEIIGKDLKHKIETALKFGKRIDGFVGMENLVKPLYGQSEDISEIFLADQDGNNLFFSGKAEFIVASGSTVTDADAVKIIRHSFYANKILPLRRLFDWNAKSTVIREYEGKYYLMIPIVPPFGGNKGILGIAFSKSVIDDKKAVLIRAFRNKLIFSILLSAFLVGLLIEFFFIKPASRMVAKAAEKIFENPSSTKIGSADIPPEVEEIHKQISEGLVYIRQSRKDLNMNLCQLENLLVDNEYAANEIRYMREIIDGK
ncbi:MAG: hypothetical protein EHM85_17165 [Desulfobacteraceae bacterium]|nr:MAG: hypothetical protein EHM85_17165 [Desulfobacteraceae bacterium]